jgi:hypothetical protein
VPLPTTAVIDWIAGLGWDVTQETGAPLVMGPYILKVPDKLVTLTPVTGPGYVLDGFADAGAQQARVRGGQEDQAGAEALAYLLDSLILGASFPAVTGGYTLIHVHRLGSTPAPLAPNPDDAQRYEYVCPYLFIAGT